MGARLSCGLSGGDAVCHAVMRFVTWCRVGSQWRDSLFEGDCWDLSQTNSPTSARRENSLEYIRIWVTPPKRLTPARRRDGLEYIRDLGNVI